MNTHTASTHTLSRHITYGAGRTALAVIGATIVSAAVVAAVAVRPSSGGDTNSPAISTGAILEAAQTQHDALIEGTLSQFPVGAAVATTNAAELESALLQHDALIEGTLAMFRWPRGATTNAAELESRCSSTMP